MTEPSKKIRNRLFGLMIFVLSGGFLVAIFVPNFVGSHTSKAIGIANNLRQLDAAKQMWVSDYQFTNHNQILEMTHQLSEQDLSPYLRRSGLLFKSVADEKYLIKPLNESPEAILVHKIDMPWPIGSMICLATNGGMEITFPDKTKILF